MCIAFFTIRQSGYIVTGMKLYLSSYKLGNTPDQLLGLLDGGVKTAVIMAAQDYKDPETRVERLEQELADLKDLGLRPEELDLREYFNDTTGLRERLASYDLVWVRGGNAFVLRKALAQSGADNILVDLIQQDQIVYGGYSAGVCVLAPSLHGLELVDVEDIFVEGYPAETIWDGLGLVPYAIVPHYRSDHYESDAMEDVVNYFEKQQIPYRTLEDGEALVVGDETS